ncbi:MAG: RNA polymerase sigma factor [Longimicrobiales bacterium]
MTADEDQVGNTPDSTPDEVLVRASLSGDDRAFAGLVRRYLRRALAVALEYAPTREDAEDIVQDTFRRVLENLDRYDTARSFQPWFFTILRNTARNAARQSHRRAHEALTAEHPAGTPGPFQELRRRELRQRIADALDRLPSMQKTCFRLCLMEGLSSAEAAHAMGLAESTVRVHVFKARQKLQMLLAAWRDELEGV